MVRLSFFLAFMLMLSAFSLVTARFQSRQLYVQLETLNSKARELDTEWRRLQLERAELARKARVDQLARSELDMTVPAMNETVFLPLPPVASSGEGRP